MTREKLSTTADVPGMRLLVLHGSRARSDAGTHSDWDFAYLAREGTDVAALLTRLTVAVGTDAVDLVDLAGASAVLRFRAARDGVVLFERPVGVFLDFQLDAVQFWCDAGAVIRAAQADVLAVL